MSAVRPDPSAPLVGRRIRLDALTDADLPALHAAIGRPEVFAGGFGGGPAGYRAGLDEFVAWAATAFSWGRGNVYAVRLASGPDAGALVGTSTLADFDEPNEHAHIGWTAYDPRVWGSAVNPEAKLLLLGAAFDAGFGRVKIQADELNARSRAAIAKLGATFEGLVRRDKRRADGTWRDTAVFSIIIDDWPRVRAGLEARLAGFGAEPVRFSPDGVGGEH
ncbi:GNAT family protein [Galbitalea sp. SE-J8]|uniref:GNAT family N-acetyltransferase n=1 Tax=Galbitalea sp. SE-J8 TaxID=3054952 RepID=UPI00259C7335|nr:GNAT family protein [Galbitalea sp. SE-J8]MDM4762257.1 GNAT family protein [Galbitalea sp. SE-J8]